MWRGAPRPRLVAPASRRLSRGHLALAFVFGCALYPISNNGKGMASAMPISIRQTPVIPSEAARDLALACAATGLDGRAQLQPALSRAEGCQSVHSFCHSEPTLAGEESAFARMARAALARVLWEGHGFRACPERSLRVPLSRSESVRRPWPYCRSWALGQPPGLTELNR